MKTNLKLQDIQGLDSIGFWPLAAGWWILIGLVAVLAIYLIHRHQVRQNALKTWQYQVMKELENLEKSLTPENSQQISTQLSALVRRLAIHRFSREECASLDGKSWLSWLTKKDPADFNWVQMAKSVMEAPFRPEGSAFDSNAIQETLKATRKWVQ